MSKRSILRSLVQFKKVAMGIVSITFFMMCVVILLNPFVASAKMAMMGKVAGRLLMGMAVKV